MSETTYNQRYAAGDSNTAGAFAFDTISAKDYAVSKVAYGAVGAVTYVDATNPLPVTIPAGATFPAKNEDAAHVTGDTGVFVLAVRADSAAVSSGTDGDYSALIVDASGRLHVNVGNTVAVSNAALSVTGGGTEASAVRVTIASDSTGVLSVDDNGASLTIDNAALSVTGGGVEASALRVTIATDSTGVLSVDDNGGSLTVDGTVAATQSGTWNIATLTSITNPVAVTDNSGSLTVDDGGLSLTVDGTIAATQSGTWNITNVSGTVSLPTGASTLAEQQTQTTALQLIDNIVLAEDAAHNSGDPGVQLLAVRKATPANLSSTDGDYEPLQVSAGRLWVDASGVTLTVGSHAVTNAGTFAVQIDGTALTRLTDIETNTDYGATTGNGAAAGSLRVTLANDSTGVLATLTTLTGGGIAHDGVDSGNPHKIGAKATTSLSAKTMVASDDRTDLFAGVDGVQITREHCNLEDIVSGDASNTDGTATQVIGAAGAGIKQYLTSITLTNTSATDTYCQIKSGTTVKWTFPVPKNGGVVHSWNPPLPPNAANEAWNFDMGAAVTTAYCSMSGFKSKI